MREAYITLDTYAAPRVSGGLCITLYDLLRIGQMVCDGGLVDGTAVIPGGGSPTLRANAIITSGWRKWRRWATPIHQWQLSVTMVPA